MPKIAAVLHTYNEEAQIARCLESLKWVDHILLVDTHSTDRTVEIARSYTDHILQRCYVNAATTKNWALDRVPECDWLLFVDADEVVPAPLAEEIRQVIRDSTYTGYAINILTHFGNRPSRSIFWNPNYQIRLFRKGCGRWDDREVHARLHLQGSSTQLQHPILHFPYPSIESYFTKFNRYTSFEARQMQREGAPLNFWIFPVKFLLRSFLRFIRLYVKNRGYRDGLWGLIISLISGLYPFFSDAKYWEASASKPSDHGPC